MGEGSRLAVFIAILCVACAEAQQRYFGKEVGALSELHHGVRGRVYAVDARTLYLRDFHYDGEGPAAYFYVGSSKAPGAGGTRLRDERGSTGPLRRYRGEGVTLALPDGTTLKDVRWFSVWCDEYSVNFGDVSLPRELEHPRPARLGALRGVHGVSSDPLVVVDAQTLLLPNFSYDGEAPDAKFWVGRGEKPSPAGIRIPDENGKEAPLRRYDKKTIVLTLPGELTVFDIGHFAVWCEAFTVNFGHVVLPRAALANVPPSLKMLGVSPQSRNKALSAGTSPRPRPRPAIARLDATTYRPRTPGHLHRRADTYTPPQEQLIQDQPNHQQYQQQSEQFQLPQQQFHNVQQQPELFQQQIQQQNQQQQYHDIQQQQPFQNAQQIQQNYQLYNPNQLNYQQLLLQQQLYEQQRLLLEQQLRNEQYRLSQLSDQGPVQYHLLPHQNERKHREAETEVTIQKSVDLDLNAGLRS